jgi:arylsulfatase A-like enzyme
MKAFWILTVLLVSSTILAQTPGRNTRPNVFLITIDTLRADHVGCYGYQQIQTPALDELAKDGTRFAHAFTPSPITNSSHTSIMTALLPSHHGVTDFAVPLDANHATLADVLQDNGYHTAAFIGAVILDSKTLAPGLDHGFDFYDNFPEHPASRSRFGRLERRAMEVTQHAENWLTAHPAGPHFVWLHLYDPHDPYEPPSPFAETYKDRPYDGEIAYADSALGHFITYLKRRGWYENSIVIVVGDHGEGLGEHHENTHGIFLYDSTTHVPLIVKLPSPDQATKVVEVQVRTTDILPTVLDQLKIAPPKNLDAGKPKAGLLLGRQIIRCASAGRPCARFAMRVSNSSKRLDLNFMIFMPTPARCRIFISPITNRSPRCAACWPICGRRTGHKRRQGKSARTRPRPMG